VSERDEVLLEMRERARFYAGLTQVGLPRRLDRAASTSPSLNAAPTDVSAPVDVSTQHAVASEGSRGSLTEIRDTIGDCQRCKLAKGRKNIVFGQGNPNAKLMFVGEAPGADEDEQGLAFVGRAGQLLTDIIEKGLKMRRADVFIANVIKCRPPQNRNPEPDEIRNCQPFLEAQIDAIRPKVLVGLGKFGAQWLLKTAEPISRIRGRLGSYNGIHVMPTYHPAYLLRDPGKKKDVWEDMKVVLSILQEA